MRRLATEQIKRHDHKGTEREAGSEMDLLAQAIVDTAREPLLVLDGKLRIKAVNRSFYEVFHVSPEETADRPLYELGNRQWDIPELRELLENILPNGGQVQDFEG